MSEEDSPIGVRGLWVVLAVAVVLAGCNALLGAGGGSAPEAAPKPTVTPVPVPSDTPTPTPGPEQVPGLSAAGVENISALFAAHRDSLRNWSFTVRINSTAVFENGTVADVGNTTGRVGRSRSQVFIRSERGEINRRGTRNRTIVASERWYGNNQSFYAVLFADTPAVYAPLSQENAPRLNLTRLPPSLPRPTAENSRMVGRIERPNTTLYRIEARLPSVRGGSNITISALVDLQGRIHVYRARGIESGSINHSQRMTIRYTDIGSTTVERPPWYEDAIANIPTLEPVSTVEPATPDTTTLGLSSNRTKQAPA